MAKVKADLTELNKLMRSLKKDVRVRVGILGSKAKAEHGDSHITNAKLGAVHEFGADITIPEHNISVYRSINSDGDFRYGGQFRKKNLKSTNWQEDYHIGEHNITIPARSFLRQPLEEKLSEEVVRAKKEAWNSFFQKNKPEVFFNYLGAYAVRIIHNAFQTQGNGQWKSLTAATKRAKANKNLSPNILTATGQLQNSISMKVINK